MRIVLRFVAIIVWLAVAGTARLIWRFWHFGHLAAFIRTGFGVITLLGWALVLTVGPFAAIYLWRFREGGRRASLLLASSALVYYIVAGLLFRDPGPLNPIYWLALAGNGGLVALLSSPFARNVCRRPESPAATS